MSNSLLIRTLVVYATCVAVALFVGYQLASWDDRVSFGIMIGVLAVMLVPLLLKWHHIWLIAAWSTTASVFFLPGKPSMALTLTMASLLISVLQHAINQESLVIPVRTITLPLIFLTLVILVTARLTGGIGLNVAGSENVGGKRYIFTLGAILGYFALTAQRIPAEKTRRYTMVYFLSPVTSAISDISMFVGPSAVYYIFLLFPSSGMWEPSGGAAGQVEIERLGGIAAACTAVTTTMMALYGIGGIFTMRKPWRSALFLGAFIVSMLGGYRSVLVSMALTFALLFWLEGLFHTGFFPAMIGMGILIAAVLVPFADQLPLSIQRTMSVIPFLHVSQDAEASAKASSDWRLQVWAAVLPDVPHHLLLGKGYSINSQDLAKLGTPTIGGEVGEGSILAGDYHNGPLSVIMPFGLAGVAAFLWFLGAGIKVLYYNYKYGDPALHRINTYFLAMFIAKIIFFFGVFGSLYSDLALFTGILGMNVSLNGGMRQPVRVPKKRTAPTWKFARAQPAQLN